MTNLVDRPAILVIEDQHFVLLLAMDMLDDLGFQTIPAPNADWAISIMEHRIDIRAIFTDVRMPGSLDGLGLARAVRDRWPTVKILVTSGIPLNQPNTLPPGSAFLKKPYNLRAVQNGLHDVFA